MNEERMESVTEDFLANFYEELREKSLRSRFIKTDVSIKEHFAGYNSLEKTLWQV